MKPFILKSYVSCAALGMATLAAPAFAQDQAPAAKAEDAIVVTAASSGRTARNSSISVAQISQEAITNFTPRSQAEVLRAIPGLNVQDTAGPGGNANIGVRGIPVATGNITVSDALGSASVPTYNTASVVADRLNYTKS